MQIDWVNDSEISRLISVPKRVTVPPSKTWRQEPNQLRKDFNLESADGSGEKFRAFARQSVAFPENFSIGLEYIPQGGEDCMILIRCNGPHGDFNNALNADHPHFHAHVHKASSQAIANGERPEKHAERTDKFGTVTEAMRYFLDEINVSVEEQHIYFEEDVRMTLFDSIGGVQ